MRLAVVKNWFGSDGAEEMPVLQAAAALGGTARPPGREPVGSVSARVRAHDLLWGFGHSGPGGGEEVVRFARPFGVVADTRLLVVGAGAGGGVRALADGLGATVVGFEADAELAAVATARSERAGIVRRASVHAWSPGDPHFGEQSSHHAIAIDALRHGPAEPVLAALQRAVRPRGHLVLTETVADQPSEPVLDIANAWSLRDGRSAPPSAARTIARALGRLGFDIRVTEDVSSRHLALSFGAWRRAIAMVRLARPEPEVADVLVAEAELWLLRARLIRAGAIRQMQWHAIRRAEVV